MIERKLLLLHALLKRLNRYKTILVYSALIGVFLAGIASQAQPAKGADKYLGNITTNGTVRSDFLTYWNQIVPENECKWGSVEGTRGVFNWSGGDRVSNFAKQNNIPWKFHNLVWGGQQPSWITGLSQADQLTEVGKWFDSAAARYPDVQMIDVVNEGYPTHAPAPYKNALGGDGTTGYDWIIKAFQMARQRWPKAILIYNDYNNCEYSAENTWTVNLVNAFKKANAPLDAIGCQAHDVWMVASATVKSNLDKIAATGIPIVISEFDIPETNDSTQLSIMKDRFTMFWNHPSIIGITYWGYVVGSTWKTGTGLLNTNGTERPALTWLMSYVAGDKNPPNDFPSMLNLVPTGVISPYVPFASTLRNNSMPGPGLMQIFDLQGRMTGSYYVKNRTVPVSSMIPASGNYVVKLDGRFEGTVNKIR